MRSASRILAWSVAACLVSNAAADVTVIYTNIAGHPTAQVPGVPGEQFRSPLEPFLTLYGSPVGFHWIFKAFTDNPSSDDNEVIVVGSRLLGTVVAREGQPSPIPGRGYGFLDSDCGVNDSGRYIFGNRLTGGSTADDEILFAFDGASIVAAVREGDAAPGLFDPGGAGDELYGNSLNSAHILNDGTAAWKADLILNIDTDYESALYHGSTMLVQEGTSAETLLGGAVYDSFTGLSGNTFSSSADGSSWIVEADIEEGLGTTEAVIVEGVIQITDGDVIGALPSPVESISAVDMSGGGAWFAVGVLVNGDRWAVRNGAVIAATGEPITVAAGAEHYGASILDADGNSGGDYYVIATTDNPDAGANQVVVLNGTTVIARTGDPVDLDGNGKADDDAFIDAFGANDSFFTDDLNDDLVDDRELYTFGELRDGAGAALGDAFFVVRLAVGPVCPWDLDGDGLIGVTDLLAVLGAWGTDPGGPPDFDGNGAVGVTDLLKLLALWGSCP